MLASRGGHAHRSSVVQNVPALLVRQPVAAPSELSREAGTMKYARHDVWGQIKLTRDLAGSKACPPRLYDPSIASGVDHSSALPRLSAEPVGVEA